MSTSAKSLASISLKRSRDLVRDLSRRLSRPFRAFRPIAALHRIVFFLAVPALARDLGRIVPPDR